VSEDDEDLDITVWMKAKNRPRIPTVRTDRGLI